jgi:hypothetical protein
MARYAARPTRRPTRFPALVLLALGPALLPAGASAQQKFDACYVPAVGALYLINLAGLPTECLSQDHVPISWSEGAAPPDGSVTPAMLSFDPATQVELDAVGGSGTVNDAENPVDWTKLKNVPGGFADGVDNSGGTPSDLDCTGCVSTTDVADGAITAAKLAAGVSSAIDHGTVGGLSDDDHPQYLLADGARTATNGFAVTGTLGVGTIPATGFGGSRLMWHAGKAAFRAGEPLADTWDDANVGRSSVAFGFGNLASGQNASAIGNQTIASGRESMSTGFLTTSSGTRSTAMGYASVASAEASMAIGQATTASGDLSTAMGANTTAQAYASVVLGRLNVISGSPSDWLSDDVLGRNNWDLNATEGDVRIGNETYRLKMGVALGGGGAGHSRIWAQGGSNWLMLGSGSTDVVVVDSGTGLFPWFDNTFTLGQSTFRWSAVYAANGVIQTSDAVLKRDIAPLTYGLDEVRRLQPVSFRWKDGDDGEHLGLLAQDVREVVPEVVHGSGIPGEALGMNYGELLPVLINAIQEQQEQIEQLQLRLDSQRPPARAPKMSKPKPLS